MQGLFWGFCCLVVFWGGGGCQCFGFGVGVFFEYHLNFLESSVYMQTRKKTHKTKIVHLLHAMLQFTAFPFLCSHSTMGN